MKLTILKPVLALALSVGVATGVWAYAAYRQPSVDWDHIVPLPPDVPQLVTTVLPPERPKPHVKPQKSLRLALLAAAEDAIGKGPRELHLHRHTLWCATFFNDTLKRLGAPGTGSDEASSFAHYGRRIHHPEPGTLAIKSRRGGNHVVIVKRVVGNKVVAISPNGGHNRVRITTYPIKAFYAFSDPDQT